MAAWQTPDDILWTLQKGERLAEARTADGIAPPELRIYTKHGPKSKFDLMWSQVLKDVREVRALALDKRKEFEASGWVDAPPPPPAKPAQRRRRR